jgi:hypothetical protein
MEYPVEWAPSRVDCLHTKEIEIMTHKKESYRFRFHFDQTLWATALLLEEIGRDVYYLDIARLLYIAERNHLATEGEMFMGGTIYATKRGPVLGKALHLIKGCDIAKSDEWARHIRILPKTHCVRLIHFPDNFRLWHEQRHYLYDAVSRYYEDKKVNLEKLVTSFPEWKKYKPTKTEKCRIIPWEEILKVHGRKDLLEHANRSFRLHQLIDELVCKARQ